MHVYGLVCVCVFVIYFFQTTLLITTFETFAVLCLLMLVCYSLTLYFFAPLALIPLLYTLGVYLVCVHMCVYTETGFCFILNSLLTLCVQGLYTYRYACRCIVFLKECVKASSMAA